MNNTLVFAELGIHLQNVLQVVDMRWGVRDEATDDHMTTELCMREIANCQRLSMGPNFVVSVTNRLFECGHHQLAAILTDIVSPGVPGSEVRLPPDPHLHTLLRAADAPR